jgi:hypothetical protein
MSARALHNAARYWCISRQADLIERYGVLRLGHGDLERASGRDGLNAWAEFVALKGILEGIERLDPEHLPPPDRLRELLRAVAATSTQSFGRDDDTSERLAWEADHQVRSRTDLCAYVTSLALKDALAVPTVPYRRRLDLAERRKVIPRIRKRWPSGTDTWRPDASLSEASPVLRVQTYWLMHDVAQHDFRRMLLPAASGRVWMLWAGITPWSDTPDITIDYEVAVDYCWPGHADDYVWLPKSADWMIYQDHLHATWFAGDWIVRQIKRLWPTWDQHIWTTMRYDYPTPKSGAFPSDTPARHVHTMDDQIVPVWYRPPGWAPTDQSQDARAGDE